MNYVDLNPIRAGIAEDLPGSMHTGIRRRIETISGMAPDTPLPPIAGVTPGFAVLAISTVAYLDLVDWTARQTRPDKRGRIDAATPRILATLGLSETAWSHQVLGIQSRYARAAGSVQSLLDKAAAMGQQWLKGVAHARRLQRIGARTPARPIHPCYPNPAPPGARDDSLIRLTGPRIGSMT